MRKEDRLAARDQQNRSTQSEKPQPESRRQTERMKGSAASEQPKPPRHSGTLPLPD